MLILNFIIFSHKYIVVILVIAKRVMHQKLSVRFLFVEFLSQKEKQDAQ
jgi:hypothetical protein